MNLLKRKKPAPLRVILICRTIRDGQTHCKVFFRDGANQVYLCPMTSLQSVRGRRADIVTWTGSAHLHQNFPEALEVVLPCLT